MTRNEFQKAGFHAKRDYLRAQGVRVSSQMKSADFNAIYDAMNPTTTARTENSQCAQPDTQRALQIATRATGEQNETATQITTMNNTNTHSAIAQPQIAQTDAAQQAQTMMMNALEIMMKAQPATPATDEARVIELIHEHAPKPPTLEIKVAELPSVETARQHFKFPLLLICAANGVHTMLTGEAGSGKTSAAKAVAQCLDLDFYAQSFCETTSKADMQGFMNARGEYVPTNFRTAFGNGALFCADEFDAGNPNSNVVINAALANDECGFPDGMQTKSADFVVVACANTFGTGANSKYVGRNKLDAATLDRFACIRWDIDPTLEAAMLGINEPAPAFDLAEGGLVEDHEWLEIIRAARSKASELGSQMLISPRATKNGAKLARAGVGATHLKEMFIFKGCDERTRQALQI